MYAHTQRSQITSSPDRIVGTAEVAELTGLSRTTLWRLGRAGTFPRRVRTSANRVGYRLGEVVTWMRERPNVPVSAAVDVPANRNRVA